jgi:hypothetical protein
MEAELADREARRFVLYGGNPPIDMARMVFANSPTLAQDPSTHRFQQLAANVTVVNSPIRSSTTATFPGSIGDMFAPENDQPTWH